MTQSFAHRTRAIYAGLAGSLLLTAPTTILIARGLGPSGKGVWALILQFFFVAELLTALGAGAYYAVALGKGQPTSRLFGAALVQGFAFPIIAGLAALLLGADRLLPQSVDQASFAWLVIATLTLLVLGRQLGFILLGQDQTRLAAVSTVAQAAVQLVVVTVLYATHRISVTTVAVAFSAGAFARFLIPFAVLIRAMPPSFTGLRSVLSASLSFGWKRTISEIEDAANTRVPLVVLPIFSSIALAGVYSVALGVAEILGQVGMAMGMAGLVSFARDEGHGIARLTRLSILISGLLCLAAIPGAFLISPVFGSAYGNAEAQLLILLPTVPILALNRVLASALSARGAIGTVARGGATGLLTIAAGVLLLTPTLDTTGASLGLLGGLAVQTIILLRTTRRSEPGSVASYLIPKPSDFRDVRQAAARMLSRETSTAQGTK